MCKELEPIYEQAATEHVTKKDIKFARVNCVAEKELCQTWETPIYPTIRVFKGLKEHDIYNGPRTAAE